MSEIVRVWKEGGYGTTVWFHELDCGHITTARRRWPKPDMDCGVCDQLAALPPEESVPPLLEEAFDAEQPAVTPDEMARLLEGEAILRLRVAARLGVTPESVRVVDGLNGPPAVIVTLFAPQVKELLARG